VEEVVRDIRGNEESKEDIGEWQGKCGEYDEQGEEEEESD
jgi:hypothetical protein